MPHVSLLSLQKSLLKEISDVVAMEGGDKEKAVGKLKDNMNTWCAPSCVQRPRSFVKCLNPSAKYKQ